MAAPRLELDPVRPAHGIDGPVAGRDRPESRLLRPQPELEPPVGALAVRSVRGLVRGPARDVADGRVGEAAHELAQRVRAARARSRRRSATISPVDSPHAAVLGRDLPAALTAHELAPANPRQRAARRSRPSRRSRRRRRRRPRSGPAGSRGRAGSGRVARSRRSSLWAATTMLTEGSISPACTRRRRSARARAAASA